MQLNHTEAHIQANVFISSMNFFSSNPKHNSDLAKLWLALGCMTALLLAFPKLSILGLFALMLPGMLIPSAFIYWTLWLLLSGLGCRLMARLGYDQKPSTTRTVGVLSAALILTLGVAVPMRINSHFDAIARSLTSNDKNSDGIVDGRDVDFDSEAVLMRLRLAPRGSKKLGYPWKLDLDTVTANSIELTDRQGNLLVRRTEVKTEPLRVPLLIDTAAGFLTSLTYAGWARSERFINPIGYNGRDFIRFLREKTRNDRSGGTTSRARTGDL